MWDHSAGGRPLFNPRLASLRTGIYRFGNSRSEFNASRKVGKSDPISSSFCLRQGPYRKGVFYGGGHTAPLFDRIGTTPPTGAGRAQNAAHSSINRRRFSIMSPRR